jgi:hypothetical protein
MIFTEKISTKQTFKKTCKFVKLVCTNGGTTETAKNFFVAIIQLEENRETQN